MASLEAKRSAFPESCWVAVDNDCVVGYLISVPWLLGQIPSLNDSSCQIPQGADCLYLHDMAISSAMAGKGVGQLLFASYRAKSQALGFKRLVLTAVGDAEGYWKKLGFVVQPLQISQSKVTEYGGRVTYMYQDC